MAVGATPGPTTKADCLNSLWRAALAEEAASGRAFAAIVLHDAEDLVHACELQVFAAHLPKYAMVQLPVLPLPDAGSPLISGHYIDEFAEAHAKDLLVRQWLDAAVPAAGVGVAIDRAMLGNRSRYDGFDAGNSTHISSDCRDVCCGSCAGAHPRAFSDKRSHYCESDTTTGTTDQNMVGCEVKIH